MGREAPSSRKGIFARMSRTFGRLVPLLFAGLGALPLVACGGDGATEPSPVQCVAEDPSATVDVRGIFEYGGNSRFLLKGTITFEQEGELVRVTDTTYTNAIDRALMGEANLEGNRLLIELLPKNGDPDYTAEVLFLFGEGGATFCVQFTDTNGDEGVMGTYSGRRISR